MNEINETNKKYNWKQTTVKESKNRQITSNKKKYNVVKSKQIHWKMILN